MKFYIGSRQVRRGTVVVIVESEPPESSEDGSLHEGTDGERWEVVREEKCYWS